MTTSTQLPTGNWTLDPAATNVTVSVKKLGVFTIAAKLAVVSGTIQIDEDNQVTNVEVIADASSYTSKNPKRNEHVIGEDFLDAETHPTITFRSESVKDSTDGLTSDGTVTIKGLTVPMNMTVSGVDASNASGSFTATATIDRAAVGIDKMPSFIIGQQLDITVTAQATKTP